MRHNVRHDVLVVPSLWINVDSVNPASVPCKQVLNEGSRDLSRFPRLARDDTAGQYAGSRIPLDVYCAVLVVGSMNLRPPVWSSLSLLLRDLEIIVPDLRILRNAVTKGRTTVTRNQYDDLHFSSFRSGHNVPAQARAELGG